MQQIMLARGELWLNMQTKFDLWQAETKLHDELSRMKRLESLEIV